MRITRLVVAGLFDRFNHDLEFKQDERITIMISPNGFGKTTILKITNALFNNPLISLARMPFHQMTVHFDDRSQLKVQRLSAPSPTQQHKLELTHQTASGKEESFVPKPRINPKELQFPLSAIEDIIPALDQIGPQQWRYRHTGETLGRTLPRPPVKKLKAQAQFSARTS